MKLLAPQIATRGRLRARCPAQRRLQVAAQVGETAEDQRTMARTYKGAREHVQGMRAVTPGSSSTPAEAANGAVVATRWA